MMLLQRSELEKPTGGRRACARSRGAAPLWMILALAFAGLAWAVGGLRAEANAAGFTRLDPSRVSLDVPSGTDGLPQGWSELIANKIARLGTLSTEDTDLIERVIAELEALPFVREVGEAQVIWPDGLSVQVRVREPLACICLGEDYLALSSDGVVLPGYWPNPPDFGRGILPLIGPLDTSFRDFLPGDVLQEDRHLDALSVAVSMREHLTRGDLSMLGIVVIDASNAAQATIQVPGTRLYIEGGREVFFGRPPSFRAAGELPAAVKWRHLMDAVELLLEPDGEVEDWDLLDVRWDVPTLRPRIGYQ